jgi:hypothetical protein
LLGLLFVVVVGGGFWNVSTEKKNKAVKGWFVAAKPRD